MSTDLRDALELPEVDQIGFVVQDLEKALAHYEPLFGPFTVMDALDMEWDYRGVQETSSLKIAFANECIVLHCCGRAVASPLASAS